MYARKIWDEATSTRGTHAEKYLRARGYEGPLKKALRYHPALWHAPSRRCWPALIGKVVNEATGEFVGVHRTWLSHSKPDKAPLGADAKMALGRIKGGAVRLGRVEDALVIGEGIETTLCAAALAGLPGWAVLGSWNFKHVVLPSGLRNVVIAADHDKAGKTAAFALRVRLQVMGVACTIALPPEPGMDWADIAVSKRRRKSS